MIRDRQLAVLKREEILPGVVRLTLKAPEEFLAEAAPGTFVQVEVPTEPFPILRRPFTVSLREIDSFQIILEARGRGTDILAGLPEGTDLRVLGPLGEGYRMVKGRWLLIGGGMGAAGFPGLIREADCGMVLLGASSSRRLLPLEGRPECVTEDGSFGEKGLVTHLLPGIQWREFSSVALCGPVGMMKAVVRSIPQEFTEMVQVSTEARMGCGWGACEGCSIPASGGGYFKCCTDGPVVPAVSIDWDRWEGV